MYLMGVQCTGTPPVFGRNSLFQQNNGVFQSNSSSSNEIGLSNGLGSPSASLVGNAAFHHLNGSTLGSNSSSVAPSPVHLHQLNTNNQSNGLMNGRESSNREANGKQLHNSSLMRNVLSLNNNNANNNSIAPILLDYFPNAGNDGLNISWCHGVNSRSRLTHALQTDVSMIQADVTLADNRYPIPILGQPPLNMSDLTLEDFLLQLIHSETGKGIKFDMKSTKVVEPAFRVLAKHADYIKAPLVLHADILAGENKHRNQPVDAWTFLMLVRTRFPKSIISIGWTVDVNKSTLETGYSRNMVDSMLSIVKEYSLLQPITFLVNAALVKYSIAELQRLLFQVPNSSLTLCAQPGDPVTIDDLILYRKAFVSTQLYYDLPEDFMNIFKLQVYNKR